MPTCDRAILTANARDSSMAEYGDGTSFSACLMPFQCGDGLNDYTTVTEACGAVSAATPGATLARTVVGDSSQLIARTIAQRVEGDRRGRGADRGLALRRLAGWSPGRPKQRQNNGADLRNNRPCPCACSSTKT